VRPELEQQMKPEQAKAAVDALKKDIVIKLDDAYFGPATPPAGPEGPGAAAPPAAKP
jgi:hypothetical protein